MKKLPLLSMLLISLLLLTAEQCSESSGDHKMPDSLMGTWIHSHEEDYSGYQVYRHPNFSFPPSRGRERFDLRADGRIYYYGIAPNDGAAELVEGKWMPLNERTIEVTLPGNIENEFSAELIEMANDRLVIRKLPN
jgi:hypothetical protein